MTRAILSAGSAACLAALGCAALFTLGQPAGQVLAQESGPAASVAAKPEADKPQADKPEGEQPVSAAVARDRARILHSSYAATLEVLHDHYFHDERAVVPARAMEDAFAELARQTKIKARWISVNTKPMSVGHEPQTDFERKAAAAIAAGKSEYEQIDSGHYRRAAPIPLSDGCVGCHNGHFAAPPKSPRFAGLIITIPVEKGDKSN